MDVTYWLQLVPSTVQHKSAGQLVPVLPVWQVSAISTGAVTQPRSHRHTLEFGNEVFFPTLTFSSIRKSRNFCFCQSV